MMLAKKTAYIPKPTQPKPYSDWVIFKMCFLNRSEFLPEFQPAKKIHIDVTLTTEIYK